MQAMPPRESFTPPNETAPARLAFPQPAVYSLLSLHLCSDDRIGVGVAIGIGVEYVLDTDADADPDHTPSQRPITDAVVTVSVNAQ